MAVTQKSLRSAQRASEPAVGMAQRLYSLIYVATLLLAAVAIYMGVSLLLSRAQVLFDDLRYGRPRTSQLSAYVGHGEAPGQPTHLLALNLNRQALIVELPGGDPTKARTITGPYLVGANEDLTPLLLELRDLDGDGHVDLMLNVRNEKVVFLNKEGTFRAPTPAEQAALVQGNGQ